MFFRILNGHTQVNANEVNALPIPNLEDIRKIGKEVIKEKVNMNRIEIIIAKVLNLQKISLIKSHIWCEKWIRQKKR